MEKREIKFRAWNGAKMLESVGVMPSLPWHDIDMLKNEGDVYLNPYKHQLMQYTGLKDKNGKEIFEGDIVQIEKEYSGRGRPSVKKNVGEIFWDEESAGYLVKNSEGWESGIGYPSGMDSQIEVIGNIYENPELITNQ